MFLRLAAAVVLALLSPNPARAAKPEPLTLLFAGSSSTYWNDMPREVAKLVDGKILGHRGAAVIPAVVGRSGSDIRVYSEPGFSEYQYGVKSGQTFLEKIRVEQPDFVVLQTVCRFIMGDDDPAKTGSAHAEAITKYCEAVRAAGGEPVFYEMGWGTGDREAEGRSRIFQLAARNKIRRFAPCSSAWECVRRERPDIALQHPKDGAHPGDAGHFLNLACFYAALTGESPVGKLPRTFPVWPHALPRPDTDDAKKAEELRIAAFQPDAYQAGMPKWMYRNMSMKLTASLDEATAAYLEGVAWNVTREVSAKLANDEN